MGIKTLEVLEGTDYEVIVTRDIYDGIYTVTVQKPAVTDDIYVAYEIVSATTLPRDATISRLNTEVARVIELDVPSLAGEYASSHKISKGEAVEA